MSINNTEKVVAVVLVAVALLFVAYGELSLTGAGFAANTGWKACKDSDNGLNDARSQGTVTALRLNVKTGAYEPVAPKVDKCMSSKRVQEYGCAPGYNRPIAAKTSYCLKGTTCRVGACVPS